MAKVGSSQAQRDAASKNNVLDDQIELKEGPNILRFIQGPQLTKVLFLPTIKETTEGGQTKIEPSFMVFNFRNSGGLLDSLFELEKSIRLDLGETGKEVEYGMKPTFKWFYLAINLMDKADFRVKPVKVPKGVKDDITKLETEVDPMDNDFLMNGLYFMYDINVIKTVDPKIKNKRFGTKYETKIYGQNKFMQRVPAEWLKRDPGEIIQELGENEIFTKEMIEALNECSIDLETLEELKPLSEVEIKEKLMKNPINVLGRKMFNGQYGNFIFPQTEAFFQGIRDLGIQVVQYDLLSNSGTTAAPATEKTVSLKGSGGLKMNKAAEGATSTPAVEEAQVIEETVKEEAPVAAEVKTEETKPAAKSSKAGDKLKSLKNLKG
jgi:hypothetical protein